MNSGDGIFPEMTKSEIAGKCERSQHQFTARNPVSPGLWNICDFDIIDLLVKSKSRVVYEAKEIETKRECVVKAYSKSVAVRNHSHRQIEREIRIHTALEHPCIVQLYAWFFDSRSIYMVLESCSLSLSKLISSKYPEGAPVHLGLNIFRQLVSALVYLHSLNVLHRDIKPSNIYLQAVGGRYSVKLGDFGSAVHTRPDDLRLSIQGTTPYLAPEIVDGLGHSFPVDIWSLGITFHETLTGQLPFDGPIPNSIYKAIHHAQYVPPTNLSDLPLSILKQCIQKNPFSRPTANQLAAMFSSSDNYPQFYPH
jgi:serine/threonine protein kinase